MKKIVVALLALGIAFFISLLNQSAADIYKLSRISKVEARVFDPSLPNAPWVSFDPLVEPRPAILGLAPDNLIEYKYHIEIPDAVRSNSSLALLVSQAINGLVIQDSNKNNIVSLPLSDQFIRTVWYRPALIKLPDQREITSLTIYTRSWEPHLFLSPNYMGPYHSLFWAHEVIHFISTSLAYAGTIISLLFGIFFLYVWIHNRTEKMYFFAAFTALCWCALFTLADIPIQSSSHRFIWRFLIYCTIAGSFWGIGQFLLIYANGRISSHTQRILGLLAVTGPVLYLFGIITEPIADKYWTLLLYIVVSPGVWYLLRHWWLNRSQTLTTLIALATVVCLFFAYKGQQLISGFVDDTPLPQPATGWSFVDTPVYLINLALPTFFGICGVIFANRYRSVNAQLSQSADVMQRTLQAQALEIHQLNAERLAREKREAADIERNLIHRDLHDGIGARLVASLFKFREGRLTPAQYEETLVSSLTDIKRIVQNDSEFVPVDIVEELFSRCIEIEDIFSSSAIEFTYDVPADTGLSMLNRAEGHIIYIFQEVISNFLKHSTAKTLHVKVSLDNGFGLSIREANYPVDGDHSNINTLQQNLSSGRGLANIQARALAIGADLDIIQDATFRLTALHISWGIQD